MDNILGQLATATINTFTLSAPDHSRIALFIKNVEMDYVHEAIQVKIYESIDQCIHNWIIELKDRKEEKLVFQCLNEVGICQYEIHFNGCQMIDHTLEWDYSKKGPAIHVVYFAYREMKKIIKSQVFN